MREELLDIPQGVQHRDAHMPRLGPSGTQDRVKAGPFCHATRRIKCLTSNPRSATLVLYEWVQKPPGCKDFVVEPLSYVKKRKRVTITIRSQWPFFTPLEPLSTKNHPWPPCAPYARLTHAMRPMHPMQPMHWSQPSPSTRALFWWHRTSPCLQ